MYTIFWYFMIEHEIKKKQKIKHIRKIGIL